MLGLAHATTLLALMPSAFATPSLKKVQEGVINLDLLTRTEVPIPGGVKTGLPIVEVSVSAVDDSMFNAKCGGYAWTTTYLAGTEAQYAELDARMDCVTDDGIPFIAIETGSGSNSSSTVRRIVYEIGAPYEHLRSKFFLAEVKSLPPNLAVDIYQVNG